MQGEIDHLVDAYERRTISRRALVEALAGLVLCPPMFARSAAPEPVVRAHTLNHVSIYASNVARSKAFYQKLAGLPVRDEAKDFCEFQLDGSFLGVYALDEKVQTPGLNHFCVGIDAYQPKRLVEMLKQSAPEAHPTLEYDDQVYVRDPDGVRVQFADVNYKRK